MTRSLIIAPQWIGDAVMTEPLLRALSARGERLTVMAVPWVAPVYRAMQHIEGLENTVDVPFQHGGLQWQARRGLATRIKAGEWGKFDKAYVLPNSLKSALLPWLAGIPKRIGYLGEMRYGLLNQRLANPPRHARGSMVEHYLTLASKAVDLANGSVANNWGLTPKANQASQVANQSTKGSDPNWLAARTPKLQASSAPLTHGLTQSQYTVLAPGAEYGSAKRWPESHFAKLIAQLDNPVVLLGSTKEHALCEAIRNKALQVSPGSNIQNLAGKTSLLEAIQIIANAKNMVSNDSGLMHVAAAFGIPQVAIFGSSDPRHTPPLNDKARVLWLKEMEGLDCSPCFKRKCPLEGEAHLKCLKAIRPATAYRALTLVLGVSHFVTESMRGDRDIAFPLGNVTAIEITRVNALLKRDITHFTRTLEAHAIRHILKQHGNPKTESTCGQEAITRDDLGRYAYLASTGDIELGRKLHRGSPTVVTTSESDQHQYTLVQAIRGRDLTLVTMLKRRAKKYPTGNT